MFKQLIILLISVLLSGPVSVMADNNKPYTVVISGQIINKTGGNAVPDHKVYITSSYIKGGENSYFKEVLTDNEGFFIDSIKTSSTKGSFDIYTIDRNNRKVDTVIYYRFFRNTTLNLMVNISIDMPYHTNLLKPRFKYLQKQNGNKFYFRFIDLTKSNNIVSREWSFGDGTFSQEQNPDHIYQKPGLYRVKLTVKTNSNGVQNINSFSKLILIPEKTYCHIGGQVFAKLFPIDMGKAFLYFIDSTDLYIPVDTVSFDTLGYYIFYNLPVGEYIIKAQPDNISKYYGYMCPTYFGDVTKWQNADLCEINATGWDYDIHLIEKESFVEGAGAINGNIMVTDKGLKDFGLFSGENITIYLYDDNNSSVNYLYTGKAGSFDFNNLDMGKYTLYPEVTGINTSEIPIELNENYPVVDSVIIELSMAGVNAIIPEHKTNPDLLNNLFPNPVQNSQTVLLYIKLDKSQEVTCSVNNILGNTVIEKQLVLNDGINKQPLFVGNLSNGIYLISVQDKSGYIATKKLVINR